jgi:STE24 endopeptidase
VAFGTLVGGLFVWTATVFDSRWWLALGTISTLMTLFLSFIAPYVLVPIFFRMRPLDDKLTTERIRSLLARAGAEVREVCSLDFSRRTAEANAAVIGLGPSRRVVLADTLLANFSPEEVDAVVAHELGHHVTSDVPRLLLGNLAHLGYVPGYSCIYLVAQVFNLATTPLAGWWSRRLEAAADAFALRLTRDPVGFAGAIVARWQPPATSPAHRSSRSLGGVTSA